MRFWTGVVDAARRSTRSASRLPEPDRLTYQAEGKSAKWYAHGLEGYLPDDGAFGFKTDLGGHSDIIDRLVQCFDHQTQQAASLGIKANKDMWAGITSGHETLRDALARKDAKSVAEMLRTVAVGPLVAGFMNIEPYERLKDKPHVRAIEAKHFADKLLSLSEALGVSTVQCIEQGEYGYKTLDLHALLAAIHDRVGFDVQPPAAGGGSFGLKTASGVMCIKDLYAIYAAYRALSLSNDPRGDKYPRGGEDSGAGENQRHATISEVGGGTGTLAYYLVKAGLPRVILYDLPTVSIIQAYYLMRSLGPEKVWLYGEAVSPALAYVNPFWALRDTADGQGGLFINQDSLPEIERGAAIEYMHLFRRKGTGLLSINQEGQAKDDLSNPQSVVFRLAQTAGGFVRRYRFPYWMRLGYVEEYYEFT